MNTTFVNSKNSKTSDTHRLLLNLTYKINLKSDKYVALSNLTMYYTWEIWKNHIRTINLNYQLQGWNEEFELPDRSYSIWDIQDCFEYIFKKHEEKTVDPSIKVYVNKIENRITLKLKQILSPTFNSWNNELTWKQ